MYPRHIKKLLVLLVNTLNRSRKKMGRFHYKEEDDDYDDDVIMQNVDTAQCQRDWRFVASPGEEGAMVERIDGSQETHVDEQNQMGNGINPHQHQTIYVIYPENSSRDGNNSLYQPHSHERFNDKPALRCPLWLQITFVAFVSQIIWYAWQYGPPAPPAPLLQGMNKDHDDIVTWNEYLTSHTSALVKAGTALFLNLPYHIISWWSVNFHADLYDLYNDWSKPRPCVLEWNGKADDEMMQHFDKCFAAQSQPLAFEKLLEALQSWAWQIRVKQPRPLVVLASSMTPGLDPEGLGEVLVHNVLYPSCPHTPVTRISLSNNMDPLKLQEKLIQALSPQRTGGLVFFSSVEQLNDETLAWLLNTLTAAFNNIEDEVHDWFRPLAQETIFFLTSSEIGRSSMIRYLREGRGSVASLLLDLRQEWQDLGVHGEGQQVAMLPFFAIEKDDVELYARFRLESMDFGRAFHFLQDSHAETLAIPASWENTVFLDPTIIEVLTGPDIVEYVCKYPRLLPLFRRYQLMLPFLYPKHGHRSSTDKKSI